MKLPRIFQLLMTGILASVGALLTVSGLLQGHMFAVVPGVVCLSMAAFTYAMVEFQLRSLARRLASVRQNIEAVALVAFDSPSRVEAGYDLSMTMAPVLMAWVAAMDAGDGFTTSGVYKGVPVAVGSHVSVQGRQMFELHHVYSYVAVDAAGIDVRFTLTNQGPFKLFSKLLSDKGDVQIGDEVFDRTWMVDTDDALAKDVYDAGVRARLMKLKELVGIVSSDFAYGSMSLILTRRGLALRWPGDMSPELASYVRDLLLDMRANILAHLDKRARAQGAVAAGVRVAADIDPFASETLSKTAGDEESVPSDKVESSRSAG